MRVRTIREAGPIPLTDTQLQVLAERASGWSIAEVAARMDLPRYEVEGLLAEVRAVLGAAHTPHAVAHAFRQGWLA